MEIYTLISIIKYFIQKYFKKVKKQRLDWIILYLFLYFYSNGHDTKSLPPLSPFIKEKKS